MRCFRPFAVLDISGWTCREAPHTLGRAGRAEICSVDSRIHLLYAFQQPACFSPPRDCPESMSSHSRKPKRPLVEVADILPPAVSVAQSFTIPAGGRAFASPPVVHHSEPVRTQKRSRGTECTLGAKRDEPANPPPKGGPPGEANDAGHKRTVKVST